MPSLHPNFLLLNFSLKSYSRIEHNPTFSFAYVVAHATAQSLSFPVFHLGVSQGFRFMAVGSASVLYWAIFRNGSGRLPRDNKLLMSVINAPSDLFSFGLSYKSWIAAHVQCRCIGLRTRACSSRSKMLPRSASSAVCRTVRVDHT